MKKLLSLITVITAMFSSNANAQTATETAPASEKVETSATDTAKTNAEGVKEKEAPATDLAQAATDTTAAAVPATAENPATAETPNAVLDLTNTLVLTLKDGAVVIKLRPDLAPNHVARILELTKQGFYNGVVFHRVIDGFMAQTGDPTGTGRGGSGQKINAEFSAEKHVKGVVSMARAADPNSADSQFFVMLADAPHLDNNYTIFGEVISGMDLIDKVKKGTGANGMVTDPDKILTMKVASDIPAEELPDSLKASAAAAPATTEGAVAAPVEGTAPATAAPATTTDSAAPAATDPAKPASMEKAPK